MGLTGQLQPLTLPFQSSRLRSLIPQAPASKSSFWGPVGMVVGACFVMFRRCLGKHGCGDRIIWDHGADRAKPLRPGAYLVRLVRFGSRPMPTPISPAHQLTPRRSLRQVHLAQQCRVARVITFT